MEINAVVSATKLATVIARVVILLTSFLLHPAAANTFDANKSTQINNFQQVSRTESFTAELSNIRALPFGFHVMCDQLALKIRSKSSATFIVRDSILCQLSATSLPEAERHSFALCSNDPNKTPEPMARKIPKCNELKFNLQEI
jgi:hypothetical protein